MSTRPNLLVFFTDQQRPDSCGCYGQPLPTTPHLDRMAGAGVRCDRAFTPNPVCGPARAALQSGRYPTATGNHVNNIHLPEDTDTVAKLLHGAGYACGYLGKWHLASTGKDGPDSFRTVAVPPRRRAGYDDWWLAADALEWTSHGYGGRLFDDDGHPVDFDEHTYRVDFMTDRLLAALDRFATDDKPFYLMASYLEPHHQNDRNAYEAPRGLEETFANAPIPQDLAALNGNWQQHYANYLGCVHSLDIALGRVLHKLDELGIADDTLIVFTSDHGCHFSTRVNEYKRSCHDASINIPLVLRGPGFSGGVAEDAIVGLHDVPATLLHAAGVTVPAHWHGRPLQERHADDWRDAHLVQISESQVGRALRTARWTYSVRVPGKPWQGKPPMHGDAYVEDFLYDNDADPHQLTNLAADPGHAAVREELRARLLAAMADAGEPAATIAPAPGAGPDPRVTGTAASALPDPAPRPHGRRQDEAPMWYRSISSHRGCPDPQIIDLAARLGFNDVCFQVEGQQQRMLAELRDRLDRSGLTRRIKGHGMTMSLWVHEFEDLLPEWGEPTIANERLWAGLEARYRTMLRDQFPDIDWLVLTVVESTIRVTDAAMLTRLVEILRRVCLEAGRRLMVRSFVWTLEEFDGVREAIAAMPDDVVVMTKCVPQDWHRGDNHDPLIGQVGAKEQVIELDIAGEYFRGDSLAHGFAEDLHRRFAFWRQHGAVGISVRVDRGWNVHLHHDHVLHEVQESNLWCLGQWARGGADDIDTPLRAWAGARFGKGVANDIAAIARLCDAVVAESLTICGEPFGDTRRRQPAYRSMQPPKEAPATIDQPAANERHRDPFSRGLAMWRWDAERVPHYDRLRVGDPELTAQKAADHEAALAKADEALARLDAIRDQLLPDAATLLRFRLEENRHHLILMGEAAQAWLRCLRLPHVDDRAPLVTAIKAHLDAMLAEWQAHRHEAAVVVWPVGRTRYLQRCTYLDVPDFCRELRRYAGITQGAPA